MLRIKKGGQMTRRSTEGNGALRSAVMRGRVWIVNPSAPPTTASPRGSPRYESLGSVAGVSSSSSASASTGSAGSITDCNVMGPPSHKTDATSSQRGLLVTPTRSDKLETRDDHEASRPSDDDAARPDSIQHVKPSRRLSRTVRSLIPASFRLANLSAVVIDNDECAENKQSSPSPHASTPSSVEFDTTETTPSPPIPSIIVAHKHKHAGKQRLAGGAEVFGVFECQEPSIVADDHSDTTPETRCVADRVLVPSPLLLLTTRHLGLKVTIISKEFRIFVIHLLPPHACDRIRLLAQKHVELSSVGRGDMAFRALYTYTKLDIPCCNISGLNPLMEQITVTINKIIAHVSEESNAVDLAPRSWMEPHIRLFDHAMDPTEVKMHKDGSDWTWNLMLTHHDEYSGGGTYIRALRKTIMLRQGQVLVYPGNLYHKGVDITSGARQLCISFLDGHQSSVRDPLSDDSDNACYEKDILCI